MLGNTYLLSSRLNENVLSEGREKWGRGWGLFREGVMMQENQQLIC
jgi:hypothetical protein